MAGDRLDSYVVQAFIGQGGQAAVYRARQDGTGRDVALKVLSDGDPAARARFRREALAASRVDHPRVVTIFDTGDVGEHAYIAMRLVQGPALSEVLSRGGPLPPERAVDVLQDVADAVDAVHRSGADGGSVVHRDIKAANVLLDADFRAYLSDFGVARIDDVPGMTRVGDMLGTVEYMSPEELRGDPATRASDVYSFGVLAFEVLTGRQPFIDPVARRVAHAHASQPPPSVREVNPALPPALDTALAGALSKDPARRPSRAGEVVDGIRRAFQGWTPVSAPPDDPGWTRVMRAVSEEGPAVTVVDAARDATRVVQAPTTVGAAIMEPHDTRGGRAGRPAALAVAALLGVGALGYGAWTLAERRADDRAAQAAAAVGAKRRAWEAAAFAKGVAKGDAQGHARGVGEERARKVTAVKRTRVLDEQRWRTVPAATAGQFRVVRVDDRGYAEYVGDTMGAGGGCFRIDPDGAVTIPADVMGVNPCALLAGR